MTDKQKYLEFSKKESVPVFSQPWWLDAVCGEDNWNVLLYEKGGHIWASFPYMIQSNYTFRTISMPKLTQIMGPFIKYPKGQKYYKRLSWENEVMNYFIDNLEYIDSFSQSFHHSISNWLPFYWKGFNQTTRYTYVIDKSLDIEELSKNFETDIRRRRKKADTLGVEVVESDDIETFYKINKMTFDRQETKMPYSLEFIKNLYTSCKKNDACKMYFAQYENEIIAVNFLLYDTNTVYYLMGGINPEKRDLGGMDVIQYESIKFALENGKDFDFEGSMIQSIEKYFRSFGAVQKSYMDISKVNSKALRFQTALKDMIKAIVR